MKPLDDYVSSYAYNSKWANPPQKLNLSLKVHMHEIFIVCL